MRCEVCNSKINENGVCPNCGYVAPVSYNTESKGSKVLSIISLALGAAGLIYIGLPASIAAIVLAMIYKSKAGEMNGMAKAGLALGIVNIVLWAVTTVIAFIIVIISIIGSILVSLAPVIIALLGTLAGA